VIGGEPSREVTYHLEAIVEVGQRVQKLMRQLEHAFGKDIATTAKVLSLLEVEALQKLQYHISQLRRPLLRLQAAAYKTLEKQEGAATEEELVSWFNDQLASRVAELRMEQARRRARPGESQRGKQRRPRTGG
jgi:hypothetical protein